MFESLYSASTYDHPHEVDEFSTDCSPLNEYDSLYNSIAAATATDAEDNNNTPKNTQSSPLTLEHNYSTTSFSQSPTLSIADTNSTLLSQSLSETSLHSQFHDQSHQYVQQKDIFANPSAFHIYNDSAHASVTSLSLSAPPSESSATSKTLSTSATSSSSVAQAIQFQHGNQSAVSIKLEDISPVSSRKNELFDLHVDTSSNSDSSPVSEWQHVSPLSLTARPMKSSVPEELFTNHEGEDMFIKDEEFDDTVFKQDHLDSPQALLVNQLDMSQTSIIEFNQPSNNINHSVHHELQEAQELQREQLHEQQIQRQQHLRQSANQFHHQTHPSFHEQSSSYHLEPSLLHHELSADHHACKPTTVHPNFQVVPRMTKWVQLSPMTPERAERIKALALTKGIDSDTVESVLSLYENRDPSQDNHVTRFRDGHIFIKIVVGSNCGRDVDDEDEISAGALMANGGPLASLNQSKHRKRHRKAYRNPNYVKRPLNSFMLYRRSQTQSAMAQAMSSHLKLNHQNISQIIGLMWQTETQELKEEFARYAGQEKELHKALYPDYKFCPQKKKRLSV